MVQYREKRTMSACVSRTSIWKWQRKADFEEKMGGRFQLVHAKPSRTAAILLSWFLFVLGIGLYVHAAHKRHQENAEDRVCPPSRTCFTAPTKRRSDRRKT